MIRNTSGFAPKKDAIIFNIEDFGAVGDGKTNDGHAFGKAMRAIGEAPKDTQKVLYLKPDTAYRITEIGESDHMGREILSAIQLIDCSNVAIVGDNSALMLKIPVGIGLIQRCQNIHVSGLDIGYNPSPMAVGKIKSFTPDGEWFDFELDEDEDCGLKVGEAIKDISIEKAFFMIPKDPNVRQDFFIDSMELIEPGHLRVHQNIAPVSNKISWYMCTVKVGDEFIIPRVNYGHGLTAGYNTAVNIWQTDGFDMQSCHFHDIPYMIVGLSFNGNVRFKDVHAMPVDNDRNTLVAWRDGYHCKDQLKPAVWEDCSIGMLGDDVYNIANNCVKIVDVIDEYTFTIPKIIINAGDDLKFVDTDHGKYYGKSRIASTDYKSRENELVIKLDEPVANLFSGCSVSIIFTSTNPNGNLVKNCKMIGSIRVKAPVTFESCDIRTSIFYISNEAFYGEGPLPTNVTLRDCDIITTYPGQAWLETPTIPSNEELLAGAPDNNLVIFVNAHKLIPEGESDPEYKATDIRIENCRIHGKMDFNGNDVEIKNCTFIKKNK